ITACGRERAPTCNCSRCRRGPRRFACSRFRKRSGSADVWWLRTQYVRRSIASGRPAHPRSADPFRNHPVRRNELDPFARSDHLPSAFVYLPMVEVTKREKVGEVALSALRPELDVMGTGPIDRPVTPGRRAAAMPSLEGSPLRRRDRTCRPPDVVLPQGFVEAVDGRPQRRRTLGIQKGVQLVHATQLAQVQVAPLVVLFVVFLKTLGVPDLARSVGQVAEVFDREAPGVVNPVL